MLAAREARAAVPIASITKLMTVLVALEHRRLRDVVVVDPRAAAVGESTIGLRAGDRLTVADLVQAALVQSANDAADALALAVAPDFTAFARLMNAKARSLGMAQSHFVRPDGLDAPGHVSSAHDVTTLARAAMRIRFVRDTVRLRSATLGNGRVVHTWNDLLSTFPRVIGVKTGHTSGAGWSEVAAARGAGTTIYATLLGSPSRSERNDDLSQLARVGARAVPRRRRPSAATASTRGSRSRTGEAARARRADRPLRAVARVERPLDGDGRRARRRRGSPSGAGRCSAASRSGRARAWSGGATLVASRTVNRPGTLARVGWYAGRTAHNLAHIFLMIVTVTLNAAIDRTLTVPNFQRGQRHRASAGLTLAGGKGINVARALKTLGVPVIATGLAGGATGTRIVEALTHEAILNDFVRIEGESRTSTAVVDPAGGTYTEINEWGPSVRPDELEMLLEKLHYLAQGAELVVFAGSLPRDVAEDFYAEAIRDLARRHVPAALDCDGEPLRLGVEAEPFLVSPNQREAEALVGHEFHDDEDFALALAADRRARRAQRDHHDRERLRRAAARGARRARATAPSRRRSSRCRRSARATSLLAAFIAARAHGGRAGGRAPRRGRRRRGVDARDRSRAGSTRGRRGACQAGVEVSELQPLAESPCEEAAAPEALRGPASSTSSTAAVPFRDGRRETRVRRRGRARPRSSAARGSRSTTSCSCRPSRRVLPNDVSTATRLTRTIALEVPVVSAAMDTVTEARHGDRARARGRHRHRAPQPLDRGAGRRDRQGQALGGGDDRRAADAAADGARRATRSR